MLKNIPTTPHEVEAANPESTYALLEHENARIPTDRLNSDNHSGTAAHCYAALTFAEDYTKQAILSMEGMVQKRSAGGRGKTVVLSMTRKGQAFVRMLLQFPYERLQGVQLSPHINLLRWIVDRIGAIDGLETLPHSYMYDVALLDDPNFRPRCRPGMLLRVLTELRDHGTSSDFKNAVNAAKRKYDGKLEGMVAVIRNLFEAHGTLMVLRLDYEYHGAHRQQTDVRTAKKDMRKYLNNSRHNKLFADMLGYIWRVEEGLFGGGVHFHTLFFFDGSRTRADIYFSQKLGEYWVKITGGRGKFHSCNMSKSSYRYLAIGKVSHDDEVAHKALYSVLQYFAKASQAIQVPGVRSIDHSDPLPIKSPDKGGRPRKVEIVSPFVQGAMGVSNGGRV